MVVALAFALLATVSYGIGTVLQAIGARRARTVEHLDVMLFARLARQVPYLGGLALDAVGFLAALVALQRLPLFVVQAAVAASLGVTAVTAVVVFGVRLRASDKAALVALITGLGLLCASARTQDVAHLARFAQWLLLFGVAVVAVLGAMSARLRNPHAGIALAACAGLGFAGTAVAERTLHFPTPLWHVVLEPVALALVLYGLCGMLMFASALQRGAVTAVAAMLFAVETLVPATVGLFALGDGTRPNFAIVAGLGFVLTVGASLALARYSEALEPSYSAAK